MNNNVEEIKSRLNIVDIVGEYVRLNKAGANWKGLCPFHHEKSPSFMVNEEKQIFHCFGCAKGGDVFTFVQEIESMEFKEVLKLLAEKAGVQLEEFKGGAQDNKKRILDALELATKFYETQLWKGMGKDKIMAYIHERGLSDESIQTFRLGYAPNGWDNILKFLLGRGFSLEEISKTGLLVEKNNESIQNTKYKIQDTSKHYDRFRDRIMFPILDILGNVIGYSARMSPGADESQAKYINTPETMVYHKGKALYGIYLAKNHIKQKNSVLLVEGNLDVIAACQAGIQNTVAVSGTALTPEQVQMLKRYAENILMLFDMDSAGQKAAEKSADLCLENNVNVKMVRLSEGKDAAEVAQKDPAALIKAVEEATGAMEYFLIETLKKNDKRTAEGKQQIAKEIMSHATHISSKIEKTHWIKKIAHELDVEEKVIAGVLQSSVIQTAPKFEKAQSALEEELSFFQKRSDLVRDSLVGLVISSANTWKEFVEKKAGADWAQRDPLIRFIVAKGPENGYSFDQMIAGVDQERAKERLNKIYFAAKYRFTQEDVVENSIDDLPVMIGEQEVAYVKELQKEKLHDIIKKIKSAEQAGNKEALAKLMSEFTKLSQEIQQ